MFERRFSLFRLLGFQVWIDPSWLILAVLITWTLAQGVFPSHYRNLSPASYWWMGVAGALGLFFSIVFHELCHSLVARRYGLPMKGITLFIFGGVAEMDAEPESPRVEFLMAAAGPLSSILLALGFYCAGVAGTRVGWPPQINGTVHYLALINGMLAAFNLIPGFPLDGGRVLRSILWGWTGNLRWATRVASRIGSGFGTLLFVLGIFNVLTGNMLGGLWWFLIGMFLRNASRMSYQQLLTRRAFEGEPLKRFMNRDPVTVPPSLSVAALVEDYIYRYHFKMFPVVEAGKLLGCVGTSEVKEIPRERWDSLTVAEIATKCSSENTISPDVDALSAISAMNRTGSSRLLVVEGGRLVGIISLRDMLKLLSLKLDLEGEN
ncbi:MAG: site-2 protease family protein [Candidatus Aureabacteria bacterium]|nr:site-2 protease family protein [Candidatus Auribacterota bacterium]